MQRFVPIEVLFQGTAFRWVDYHALCQLVHEFQAEFKGLVIMMADRGITLTDTKVLRWVQPYLPE
jgi:transposase-like protein